MLDIKRSLNEILTLYFLEETLSDIYVEGATDKFIIDNYIDYKDISRNIYEIDLLDFSEKQLEFPDLNLKSNKDKLLALARIMQVNEIRSTVVCIVDRDFDGILNPLEENGYLLYTDFSCIESYLYSERFIGKLTAFGFKNFPHHPEIILHQIGELLKSLFIMRMINKSFNLNFSFPKMENNMSVNKDSGICSFEFNAYLEKYINVNKLLKNREEIYAFAIEISQKLSPDIRYNMNGHDFVEVLFNYLNKIKNTYNFRLETFEKTLFLALQPNYLDDFELFKTISKM